MILAVRPTCSQDRLRWLLRNGDASKQLKIVPANERSFILFLITGMIVVLLGIAFLHSWFGRNQGVRALSHQGFVKKPDPKPPDTPKVLRAQKRKSHRRLAALILTIINTPVHVHAGWSRSEVALIAKIKPDHWNPRQAALIRETLKDNENHEALKEFGGFPAVIDTGCSKFATSEASDFVEGTYKKSTDPAHVIRGIAGGLPIEGEGQVDYEVLDDSGRIKHMRGAAILIKDLPVRLIPPQKVMPSKREGYYSITGDGGEFVFRNDGGVVSTPLDLSSDLPMVTLFQDVATAASSMDAMLYSCVASESNHDLSPTQKEIIRWHWRLGHPGKDSLQWLATRGLLGPNSPRIAKQDVSMCATCNYGKQTRTPTSTTRTEVRPSKGGGIQDNKLEPGDEIAADQFETRQRGRRFHTGGKEKDVDKFAGGTVFSDVASGYTRVYFQVSLGAAETLRSKHQFERACLSEGKNYRTDNGIFTKEDFMESISQSNQSLSASGVGAHHQNGIAERSIRTVVTKSGTMLLHAQLRWPDQTSVDLWPMAMQHASYLNNITPKIRDGLSPEEKFSRSLKAADRLHKLPVWGCPAYVLQPNCPSGSLAVGVRST